MTQGSGVPRGPQPQPSLTPGTRPVVERTRAGIEELFFDLGAATKAYLDELDRRTEAERERRARGCRW